MKTKPAKMFYMPQFFYTELWIKMFSCRVVSSRTTSLRLDFNVPAHLRIEVDNYFDQCVTCGDPIHPIRGREEPSKDCRIHNTSAAKTLYYTPTCPTSAKKGCCKSKQSAAFSKWLSQYLELCGGMTSK